jgi:ketosteroid isomerase-like protein
MMTPTEMKRAYDEHREVEEARDLDAVLATFSDNCFLENVALEMRAEGKKAVRESYEALFTAFPDLSPTSEGFAYGDDVFVTWGTGPRHSPRALAGPRTDRTDLHVCF